MFARCPVRYGREQYFSKIIHCSLGTSSMCRKYFQHHPKVIANKSSQQRCIVEAASDLALCNPTTEVELAACLCPDVAELRKITECVENTSNYPDWESMSKCGSYSFSTVLLKRKVILSAYLSLCKGFPVPSRWVWFRTIAVALLSITIPFVLLRIYSRIVLARKYWWEDYTFIIASVSC
jgi:hypothetical protein